MLELEPTLKKKCRKVPPIVCRLLLAAALAALSALAHQFDHRLLGGFASGLIIGVLVSAGRFFEKE